jgi:hypothetical protein
VGPDTESKSRLGSDNWTGGHKCLGPPFFGYGNLDPYRKQLDEH